MQDFDYIQKPINGLNTLSLEDRQTLVDAFAWLIQEDKKQNPALYKQNNNE